MNKVTCYETKETLLYISKVTSYNICSSTNQNDKVTFNKKYTNSMHIKLKCYYFYVLSSVLMAVRRGEAT